MLNFIVCGQKIEKPECLYIASEQIEFVKLHFDFSESWNGLYKTVQFTQEEKTYSVFLGQETQECFLPSEIVCGKVAVSVFGYSESESEAVRATTVPAILHVRKSGFISSTSTPIPPTPDLYQQLLNALDEKANSIQDGADGEDGFSPVITTAQTETGAKITITDKTGTKTITLLNGTNGTDGANGENGADGISVTGSEINSNGQLIITLSNGQTLNAGTAKGSDGTDGTNGTNGKDGTNGTDGFSPVVTLTQTDAGAIISVTDADGTKTVNLYNGTNGADGTNGTNGTNGTDGVSVTNAEINSGGHLIITLSDTSTIDAGIVSSDTSASMTADEILTKIKGVDGAGSGLDADTLDGLHSTDFAGAAHTHTEYLTSGDITVDSEFSETSENPVQNKVVYAALGDISTILKSVTGVE